MALVDDVKKSYKAITRTDLNDAVATAVADAITAGTLTLDQFQANIAAESVATTQAAIAMSAFVTGAVPDSAKLDSLTAFAKLQNDYYTNVLKSVNAQLGAYEALGKAYAGDATTKAALAAKYGALSATDFVNVAYVEVFTGNTPTAGALANLVSQVEYFTKLYTDAGISAADAALQARGAVLGQIIGYAVTAPGANMSNLDEGVVDTLVALADEAIAGTTPSAIYGKPLGQGAGATIELQAATTTNVTLDASNAKDNVKATTFADTLKGTIDVGTAVTINTAAGNDAIGKSTDVLNVKYNGVAITIDGSGGDDAAFIKMANGWTDKVSLVNIEKIVLDGNGFTADAKNWTGAKDILSGGAGALIVNNVASGVNVGVEKAGAETSIFNYAAGAATANVKLDEASVTFGEWIGIGGADVKTVAVNVVGNSVVRELNVTVAIDTVTITGQELKLDFLTAGVVLGPAAGIKTFDASGASKVSIAAGVGAVLDSAVDSTIKLGAGDDTINLRAADVFKDTVTLGDGKDKITYAGSLSNLSFDGLNLKTFAEVTDFAKSGDTIKFAGIIKSTTDVTGAANIKAALTTVAAVAAENKVFFEFQGSTYIYNDANMDDVAGGGDGLIKLTGVTGAVLGADILA